MAQLIQPFNANNFDPTQGVGSLPIGKHPVVIESSEVKANKANDGGYLQLNLKVIDGPAAGNSGAYRLNLYHQNPQTVDIANRQLSAISHVTGVFMIQDSAQLHNIPFMVEVGTQKPTREQEDARARGEPVNLYTEVKRVFDAHGNEPGKPAAGGAAQTQQGQQQQPNGNANGGAWGGPQNGQQGQQQQQQQQQPNNNGNAGGWQSPTGGQPDNSGQAQGNGWQGGNGGNGGQGQQQQQQQPPANGGAAWGWPAGGQQQQQQQQPNGGQGGGWQQQQPAGGGNAGGNPAWNGPR